MDTIAGYTLVRRLGAGERAEVWLAQSAHDSRQVALKVFSPETTTESVQREIAVLAALRSRHLLSLDDVGTTYDARPFLVLPRLAGPSLSDLVARRRSMTPGELVTAVAPIIDAVTELQASGICHGSIRPSSVLLDGDGAPVLLGFGRAQFAVPLADGASATMAQIADNALLARDRELSCDLVRVVASATSGADAADLMRWLDDHRHREDILSVLSRAIYELAPSEELSLFDAVGRSMEPVRHVPIGQTAGAGGASVGGSALSGVLRSLLDNGPVSTLRSRLSSMLGSVRRPLWIIGAAGLAALVIALAVLPSGGGPPSSSLVRGASTGSPHPVAGSRVATPEPRSPAVTPTVTPTVTPSGAAVTDPLGAAVALVARRDECLKKRAEECLVDVDQTASPALAADRAVISGGGADAIGRNPTLVLVERLGDTAIIGVGAPSPNGGYSATLLLVNTDQGWRIRDTITGVVP